MKDLSVAEWKETIANDQDAVIIDVRTQDEVDEGIIEGAKHLDIFLGQEFLDEVDKLDKAKNYYVYCRSGGRSAQACALMQQKGIENTYNLAGGYIDWSNNI